MSLTGLVFVAIFIGFSGIALLRNPMYGLYLYVAVFYLDPPGRWWGHALPDLRWSLISAIIAVVAVLIHGGGSRSPVFGKGPAALLLLFVVWMWVQVPWVVEPESHWYGLSIFTKYLVVVFLIYALVDSRERLAGFLLCHGLGCLYLGYVAWTTNEGGRLDGVGGPGINDANSLAMQLGTGVYAAAAYYFAQSRWQRYLSLLIVPFVLNGLILAGSRGGFLALIAGGVAFFVCRPPRKLHVALAYGILAICALGYVASDFFWDRVKTIGAVSNQEAEIDHSARTRLVLLGIQWQMALDYPLGAGHDGTTALSYTYVPEEYHSSGTGRSSHNTLMSSLVDQGFLGLLIWASIMGMLWFRLRRHRRLAAKAADPALGWLIAGLAAMFSVVTVAGLFAPLIRTEVYIWILALACSLDRYGVAASTNLKTEAPPIANRVRDVSLAG
ncbi:MAG: O-antigen ligase family protein [Roseibium album]|uniref:O-antigen ligase family protein n=1 Tax=Roseibium album TaxID=311410 RepID=UPI0032ECB414